MEIPVPSVPLFFRPRRVRNRLHICVVKIYGTPAIKASALLLGVRVTCLARETYIRECLIWIKQRWHAGMQSRWLAYLGVQGSSGKSGPPFRKGDSILKTGPDGISGLSSQSPGIPCSLCGNMLTGTSRPVRVLAIPGYNEGLGIQCNNCGIFICNQCARASHGCPICNCRDADWYRIVNGTIGSAQYTPRNPL